MDNKQKKKLALALSVLALLSVFLPVLFGEFLIPGTSEEIVQIDKHDLDSMSFWYNRLAVQYNLQNPEIRAPFFNETQISREAVVKYKQNNFKRLIALNNEGTLQFTVYHAAAIGTYNEEKVGMVYQILLDVAAREKALQEKAEENDEDFLTFTVVVLVIFGGILMAGRRGQQDEPGAKEHREEG